MTAASTRPPFADASPAEVRAALIDEECVEFDRQYAAALETARDSYSLTELETVLTAWRRVAAITRTHGPQAHRQMLNQAEHTARTGRTPAGSQSWERLSSELSR